MKSKTFIYAPLGVFLASIRIIVKNVSQDIHWIYKTINALNAEIILKFVICPITHSVILVHKAFIMILEEIFALNAT